MLEWSDLGDGYHVAVTPYSQYDIKPFYSEDDGETYVLHYADVFDNAGIVMDATSLDECKASAEQDCANIIGALEQRSRATSESEVIEADNLIDSIINQQNDNFITAMEEFVPISAQQILQHKEFR